MVPKTESPDVQVGNCLVSRWPAQGLYWPSPKPGLPEPYNGSVQALFFGDSTKSGEERLSLNGTLTR